MSPRCDHNMNRREVVWVKGLILKVKGHRLKVKGHGA